MTVRPRPFRLPNLLQSILEKRLQEHLEAGRANSVDFSQPAGEPALTAPDSVSWRVFKNPVALAIGGITAVILELAEPRVRTGVWEHTSFRTEPLKRMQRTGLAAMITVYGGRTLAGEMIAEVSRMHSRVRGKTPDGVPYRADDPELLRWVHATASFGFLQAYHHFVKPVSDEDRNRFYSEGPPVARLYGAEKSPASEAELVDLFKAMEPHLERSEIIFEFLQIMRRVPLFPQPFRPVNRLLVRAAVELLPDSVRGILGLGRGHGLPPGGGAVLRVAGSFSDRVVLESGPAAQAAIRLGLSPDFAYR